MSWARLFCLALVFEMLSVPGLQPAEAQDAASSQSANSQPAAATPDGSQVTGSPAQLASGFTPLPPDDEGLIKLDVVVKDKLGRPVAGLNAQDFTLLDQGQVSRIVSLRGRGSVSDTPDPPVELILVLDTIDVNSRNAAYEQQEIKTFLQQNGGHLAQPVSLFKLSGSNLSTVAQPSNDGNALADEFAHGKLRRVREFRGLESTAFLELQSFGAIATLERQKPGRKLLIWIGPDWKLTHLPLVKVLPDEDEPFDAVTWFYTLLRESRIALYTITRPESDNPGTAEIPEDHTAGEAFTENVSLPGFSSDPGSIHQKDLRNLERNVLAVQSGGRVLDEFGKTPKSLAEIINSCLSEAANYYTLSFNPPRTDRLYEYHQLMLLPANRDLVARTNGGYYNQSYFYDRPNPAVRRITVEQLEGILAAIQSKSDGDIAHQLSGLELTERMSSTQLTLLKTRIRGTKATAALAALADTAAFLSLPAAEIPTDAPPGKASQNRMVLLAADYLIKTVPNLPNLFATRTTYSYEENEEESLLTQDQQRPSRITTEKARIVGVHPLHLANTDKVTVLYRGGNEVIDPGDGKHKKLKPTTVRLTTRGTFGPLAAVVIADTSLPPSKFAWSHWERGSSGMQAVFSFTVAAERRHYEVQYCCLSEGDGSIPFQKLSGYHGEIAIDPSTGAVMRLAIMADLNPSLPLIRSDILVEYGPVEIGGASYICPIRSVSISRWRKVKNLQEWDLSYRVFDAYSTSLNDVEFSDYHIFRSESRMILDDGSAPEPK